MTNEEILFLVENLPQVDAPNMEQDFNYAVSFNLYEAEKIKKSIDKSLELKPGLKAFNGAMDDLRKKHADQDEEGEPVSIFIAGPLGPQKQYQIPGIDNPSSPFQKAVEQLKIKHKKDFDDREKQLEFLSKPNKQFKPIMVSHKDVPKGLSRIAMDAVFLFVIKLKK